MVCRQTWYLIVLKYDMGFKFSKLNNQSLPLRQIGSKQYYGKKRYAFWVSHCAEES